MKYLEARTGDFIHRFKFVTLFCLFTEVELNIQNYY